MSFQFTDSDPSLESRWRALVLFGMNVASYKFALAGSLLELAQAEREVVTLEELADPFSRRICAHLQQADKQGTFQRSRFLDACRAYNAGELSWESLQTTTAKLGFVNVIDAFHVLHGEDTGPRFFVDERRRSGGIRLTENIAGLHESPHALSLPSEVESRWSLVERAWELNLPRSVMTVAYDPSTELLTDFRRKSITGSRGALNGYQKGKCFYCFDEISIESASPACADVDHFFPHVLKPHGVAEPVDGVWNLVLACQRCNRSLGKSARVPTLRYVRRLHRRNEFLIGSHHPLRETLIAQTGATEYVRGEFLNKSHSQAKALLINEWQAPEESAPAF